MTRSILCTLCMLACIHLQAQLTMTVQVSPEGLIQKPQLWNLIVTNASTDQEYIRVGMVMRDAVTNDPILNATTTILSVSNGVTVLLADNLAPIQYEYLSPRVADTDPEGLLPVGQFIVCYTVQRSVHEVFDNVSEECLNIFVEPLSPPLLISPADGSQQAIRTPQFTWIPPAPLNMFSELNYVFTLVEVTQEQTPQEAIQQNFPVYTQAGLTDIYLNYPLSQPALDTGKLYAWQVAAMNGDVFASQTEVWTFTIQEDAPVKAIVKDVLPFVRLQRTPDAAVSSCEGILKFIYDNNEADTTVSYSVSSLQEADLDEVMDSGTLSVHTAENYITIPYLNDSRLVNGNTYLLTIENAKREKWSMKFIYNAPGAE